MQTRIVLFLIFLLGFCSLPLIGQDKKSPDTYKTIRIDSKKQSVFLEYVKSGVCFNGNYFTVINVGPCEKKSDSDREYNAVWLRLVNNSRWAIGVKVRKAAPRVEYGLSLTDELTVAAAKDSAEFDVVYSVESETGCDFHIDVPAGQPCARRETTVPVIPLPPMTGMVFVPSGKSVLFAVEENHLKKYLLVLASFTYEWEHTTSSLSNINMPKHTVDFSWYDLETSRKKDPKSK